jgi:hypothetical protein
MLRHFNQILETQMHSVSQTQPTSLAGKVALLDVLEFDTEYRGLFGNYPIYYCVEGSGRASREQFYNRYCSNTHTHEGPLHVLRMLKPPVRKIENCSAENTLERCTRTRSRRERSMQDL